MAQVDSRNADLIELFISDNCSTDNTSLTVQERLKHTGIAVRYVRNSENLGYDRNVDQVVRMAQGKFVWTLSDDDRLIPGSINTVLQILERMPAAALVFANYDRTRVNDYAENGYCIDGNEYFEKSRFQGGLISSNVINKQVWEQVMNDSAFGSGWIHFAYAVAALAPVERRTSVVLGNELVAVDGESRWGHGGTFLLVGLKFARLIKSMRALGYSRTTQRLGLLAIKGGYPRNILKARSQGLKLTKLLVFEMIELFGGFISFWLVDLPALFMPGAVVGAVAKRFRKAR